MNFIFDKDFNNDVYKVDDSSAETYAPAKLNESFRSTELTTLATIEQRQESGKTVIEIGGPLSKSTIEKMKKMISNTKQKSVGEEASKQEQIDEFLGRYKSFNDVPVKDMRHIIPLLLMEVYVEKHGQYTKKVKGLWEKRPDDWPENIPFVDPNNSLKNEGTKKNVKPKKELLGQMLTYLVDRYRKMKSVTEASDSYLLHAGDPFLSFPHQSTMQNDDLSRCYELNLIETSESSELRAAEQSVSDQSFGSGHSSGLSYLPGYSLVYHQDVKPSLSSATNDGSVVSNSLSTLDNPLSGGMDVEHGELVEDGPGGSGLGLQWYKQPDLDARPPEQVVDNEEETSSGKDWNPIEEIRERTKLKLGYMKTKVPLPKGMHNQLENIHGILKNQTVSAVDDDATLKLIENWFQLEKCIDIAKFQKPCKCSDMIQNLHDELQKMVPSMDFMDNNTMKSMSVDLPVPEEDLQQFNSLLNIRPRPGPAGGRITFPPGNQLELRYLASEQSAMNNGCMVSTLSDNHKPIQLAQEDGGDQKSEKPEFSEVTRDELLPFSFNDDDLREIFSQIMSQDVQQLSQEMMPQQLSQEMSELSQEMSCPIQESAPLTKSTYQLDGKFEMPANPLPHVMTSVSVQPWVNAANPTMMSTPSFVFSLPPTVAGPSQLIPNSSIPSPTFAEECMSRLSLSFNRDPIPSPVQIANPCAPVQPLLDQLLSRPRAGGRPGSKRCRTTDEDDELDENICGPSKPAKAPTYNTMIPLVVEEISNNLDKPFPRLLKKKSR